MRAGVLLLCGLGALAAACGSTEATDGGGSSKPCMSCHVPDFQAARHHRGETPWRCNACHSQESWKDAIDRPIVSGASAHPDGPPPTPAVEDASAPAAEDASTSPAESATAAPSAPPATAPHKPKPKPKPTPKPTPSPTEAPTPQPIATQPPPPPQPTSPPPDTVTAPSRRRR